MSTALARYDTACKALAAARSSFDVQKIRNEADAIRVYARQAKNRQLEIDAAEIRIRAERRLGELIAKQKATVGLNQGTRLGGNKKIPPDNRPTLADAGIDKMLSSRSQRLAKIPSQAFERLISEWRAAADHKAVRVDTRLGQPSRVSKSRDESTDFTPELAIHRVVSAIRSIAVEWPATRSIDPFVEMIRQEADRLVRRWQRKEAS